jgi:hypothetical protein
MRAVQLGLPSDGVPAGLVDLCEEWLKRRGRHPSGKFWQLVDYEKRAANPSEWMHEIAALPMVKGWGYIQHWLNGVIPRFGIPHQISPAILRFLIDNNHSGFARACAELEMPMVNLKWRIDTGIVITLEGVDPCISIEDWKKIFERLAPLLAKEQHGTLDVESRSARTKRPNLERDLFFYAARNTGLTYKEACNRWCDSHPEDKTPTEDSMAKAVDELLDLMLPRKDWIVGDRSRAKRNIKEEQSERAKHRRKAEKNSRS